MPDLATTTAAPSTEAADSAGSKNKDHLNDGLSDPLGSVQEVADSGTGDPGGKLPHLAKIQQSFGPDHDVSGVSAHSGPSAQAALNDMGAQGYATGNKVALKNKDLHTAAHEAAHVVQQRQGVHLKGGAGEKGDTYEKQANAVADAVVAGKSAAPLLGAPSGGQSSGGGGVQFQINTWNPETKAFESAAAARDGNNEGDKRFFTGVQEDAGLQADLKGGALTAKEAVELPLATVQQINPQSDVPKNIIRKATKTNWNNAKHTFAEGHLPSGANEDNVDPAANKAIMQKLWEYRQWHHEKVLKKVQRKINQKHPGREATETEGAVPQGLSGWAAAGSTSLTSDIDVNLKGSATEEAVGTFNAEYKREYGKEAGVVYDVNVYALDFMHGTGVKVDETGAPSEDGNSRLVSQEGSRKGMKQGGIEDEAKAKKDLGRQEEWADLKIRLYMNDREWAQHKRKCGGEEREAHWGRVEKKYKKYRAELKKAMTQRTGKAIHEAEDVRQSGYKQIEKQAKMLSKGTGFDSDNVMIGASNDIYEKKLKRVKKVRDRLRVQIDAYNSLVNDNGQPLEQEDGNDGPVARLKVKIDKTLLLLREITSEAALYSNEAYLTDGAVNHTVVGLQIGKKLNLSKGATLNAVQENMADAIKEIGRHGETVGDAAYKSGKYFWRMADAAQNMDIDLGDRAAEIFLLKRTGQYIANDLKSSNTPDKPARAAEEVDNLGITSVNGLKKYIIKCGQAAINAYNEQVRGSDELDLADEVDKDSQW